MYFILSPAVIFIPFAYFRIQICPGRNLFRPSWQVGFERPIRRFSRFELFKDPVISSLVAGRFRETYLQSLGSVFSGSSSDERRRTLRLSGTEKNTDFILFGRLVMRV